MDKRVLRKSVGSSFAALALVGTLGLTPVLAQEPTTTATPAQTEAAKPEEWSFTGSVKVPDDLLAQLKAGRPGRGNEHGQGPGRKEGCHKAPRDEAQAGPKGDKPAPKDDAQAPKDDTQATEPKAGEETPAPTDDAQAPKDDAQAAPKGDRQAPKDDAQAQARDAAREQLQALATVTADEAEQAALAGFSGATAGRVDLRPINGYLVYSVHLTDEQGQHQEVIVDAGNAQVLATRAAGPHAQPPESDN